MIENGLRPNIGFGVASGLARALGVSTDWLVLGTGREPKPSAVKAAVAAARKHLGSRAA